MTARRATAIALGFALLGTAVTTRSQDHANLKVLPRDIPAASIGKLMKRYEEDLGVSCSYCHVENPQTQKLDYASDDNPTKETARIMIAMLNDINSKYLSQLGDRRYAVPVTCGSCHQGQSNPPGFEAKWR
jgi:hypothetical protein